MSTEKKQCDCTGEVNVTENIKKNEQTDNNWITEEDDRKNWEGWLVSKARIDKIIQIRHAVTKLWQNCEERFPPLPYYTPHGPAHAKSVEDIIHRLLPGEFYKKLKEIERYYLLVSAWTHDVGMIRGLNEKEDVNLHPAEIREEHHERSERYIVNNYLMLDIDEKDAPALGLLAFFHRKRESIEKCPDTFAVGNEMVRLRLLAAYLRLADSLDVDQSRAPSSEYAICLAYNIPFASKLHWIKSRLVSGIAVLPKDQRILVNFKQPHEKDLEVFCSNRNRKKEKIKKEHPDWSEGRYDIELLKQNLAHLQQNVMDGLREELDSVKTTLIRGGITCYLDVTYASTEMVIDDHVFPEIIRLADDLDMIVHPSATRLILLLLDTVKHIIDRYLSPLNKSGGCNADDCGNECFNIDSCQMPRIIKKEIAEFIAEIKDQVIDKRKCHVGLKSLVEELDNQAKYGSIKEIKENIQKRYREIEDERRKVRSRAYRYFYEKKCKDKEDEIKKAIGMMIDNNSERKSIPKACVTVVLYGYSELVIKALSGFRDAVIRIVISELNKFFDENQSETSINNLHKINTEDIASNIFRIFVCEGQPKTITAPNDTLQYHDGTRFAIALGRRGFKNVVIIPDLVAGSLLQKSSKIDFVLLGVNGVKLNRANSSNNKKNIFLHSSGHVAIANLTKYKKNEQPEKGDSSEKGDSPKLVLVLSMSKCKFYDELQNEHENNIGHGNCSENRDEDELEERKGYYFWRGYGEKTRKEAFFSRDIRVKKELHEYKISLYNPREDEVQLDIVDHIISDKKFYYNKDEFVNDIPGYKEEDNAKGGDNGTTQPESPNSDSGDAGGKNIDSQKTNETPPYEREDDGN